MNEDITCKRLGNLNGHTGGNFAYQVYDPEALAPTLRCVTGGGTEPMIIEDPISTNGTDISGTIRATYYKNGERNIAKNIEEGLGYEGVVEPQSDAMRGRYVGDNGETEQQLELESEEVANCITSVGKDSMIMEKEMVGIKQATAKGYIECEVGGLADLSYPDSKTRRGRVEKQGQICPTLTASNSGICRIEKMEELQGINTENDGTSRTIKAQYYKTSGANFLRTGDMGATGVAKIDACQHYRIRKLTPKECFRLMDFSDEDFKKAEAVNSNTKLYAQAGNSIVCNVLVALFGQMFEGKEDIYKQIDNKFNNKDTKEMDECGDYLHHIQNNIYKEDTMSIKKEIHPNMKYFKEIYSTLENDDMKKFFKVIVKAAPPYFWEVGASSTGKYHPSYALGDGGLVRHTCAVVRFLNHAFEIECMNTFTSRERDILRIAGAAHDMLKSGTQEDYEHNKYTKHEHPILAANMIREFGKKCLSEEEVELMATTMESHMGAWNVSNRSPIVLPVPKTKYQILLHMADYYASRKDIEVRFDE